MNAKQTMLKFTSNPKNVERVESFIDNVAQEYRITPDRYGDILISLTEAVNNAIIHGNSNDESKMVEVKLEKKRDSIAFWVSDQGKGFDPKKVPDPTTPENICNCGGRGVFLMRELSDQINFHDNGRTVEMRFKL